MSQIKHTVVMILGGAALLAGLGLLTLLGLATAVIPPILGILAIERARAAGEKKRARADASHPTPANHGCLADVSFACVNRDDGMIAMNVLYVRAKLFRHYATLAWSRIGCNIAGLPMKSRKQCRRLYARSSSSDYLLGGEVCGHE